MVPSKAPDPKSAGKLALISHHLFMKTLLCGLLTLTAVAGYSAGTAYEALRVVGKARGDAVLDRVIEVRGTKGAPLPRTWKIAVLDDKAPNGVREFDVQGTAISGERTPQAVGGGEPMNMSQLNLDSDGAHTVAEREAKKTGFAYDHVNYLLRGIGKGGNPVWEIRLVDEQNGNTAVLTMGAETGKLVSAEGLNKGSAPVPKVVDNNKRPRDGDPEYGQPPVDEDGEVVRIEERRRVETKPPRQSGGNGVTRFFDRASRHIGGAFQRFGDRVERTFTGEPAPRRVERRATPPPSNSNVRRDSNGTEYYRPRD
jgi:hypothetical protein